MIKKKFKCEMNNPVMKDRVQYAFELSSNNDISHDNVESFFEHGQWFVQCKTCGYQASVNDAVGGDSVDGFSFETVTEGDGYCEEIALEDEQYDEIGASMFEEEE